MKVNHSRELFIKSRTKYKTNFENQDDITNN